MSGINFFNEFQNLFVTQSFEIVRRSKPRFKIFSCRVVWIFFKIIHKIGNEGIFASLWNIAEYAKIGLEVDIRKIPIRQETVEVCNFMDVNPYEFLSGGSLLLITEHGAEMVEKLNEMGVMAAVIGKTTDKKERVVTKHDRVRFLGGK